MADRPKKLRQREWSDDRGYKWTLMPNDEGGTENAYLRLAHADSEYITDLHGDKLRSLAAALESFREAP